MSMRLAPVPIAEVVAPMAAGKVAASVEEEDSEDTNRPFGTYLRHA
jgi:hypothetical protein